MKEFINNLIQNIYFIAAIILLMVFFVVLYFRGHVKYIRLKRRYFNNAAPGDPGGAENRDIIREWTEQYQVIEAQLELMSQLSTVGLVSIDTGNMWASADDNAVAALGLEPSENGGTLPLSEFRSFIAEEDLPVFDECLKCENIREESISRSTYVVRIKPRGGDGAENGYKPFLFRVKPVYDDLGTMKVLVAAFMYTGDMLGGE